MFLRFWLAFPLFYSYDRMLSTNGNTAIYLQFAHARLASILRKAEEEKQVDLAALKASPEIVAVEHDSERGLAFELLMFSDVIEVSNHCRSTSPLHSPQHEEVRLQDDCILHGEAARSCRVKFRFLRM